MTLNLGILYALTALISCSMLSLLLVAPAMAQEDSEKVKIVINVLVSANAEVQTSMLELQERGIDIPLAATAYHAEALKVYRDAERALEFGDAVTAKIRAMKAMELFKKATDELRGADQSQDETAIVIGIEDRIARLNHKADYLKTLANNNHESINFSSYASAINSARDALKDGSIEEAKEQLEWAESNLADIRSDIQDDADRKKDTRAKEFAQRMVTRLSEMMSKMQEHNKLTTSSVSQFSMFIEKLRNATNANEIMNMTDNLSELQSMISEFGHGDNNDSADSDVKEDDDRTVKSGSGSDSGSGSSGSGSDSGSGSSGSGSDNDDDDDRDEGKDDDEEKDDEEEDDD